ncbi:MBL fold metallo-hydrolase [bacterium]|nr:MBL fold metallo-hydrolase [bacterium]
MIVEMLTVGIFQENTFLVGDSVSKKAFVVDPGGPADELIALASKLDLEIECILNTHGHIDHVFGASELQQRLGIPFRMHEDDNFLVENLKEICGLYGMEPVEPPRLDDPIKDEDVVKVGELEVKVIHTPGHSPGGVCLSVNNHLFAGDTLFAGSIGRTDLPGGDHATLMRSIAERIISALPPNMVLHSGHGPDSSLVEEAASNPFLRRL